MPTILDFQINPLAAESYSLAVCERGNSQTLASASFSHRVDFLTDFSVDRLNASTKDAAERFDELQKLGRELYQKLFPPTIEQVWREYKQRSEFLILCLRFAEGAAKLEVLPWETLHDGTEFIAAGAQTTMTRLPLDVAPPSELPPIPRPLKLFGFFASPLDLGDHERLNAEREQEILLEAINDPAAQGRISADFEDEAKLEILERSLKDGYHILHFTGHGISPRDGGGLLLEDAQGKKLPASIAEVMQAVQRGQDGNAKLRLAVISGCQTARTLHTQGFSDLARELLRQRVPAVIAMQFSISDEGGLKFAEVLYREIAKGVALEHAVHVARCVLLADERFFINNDALAIVLLAADGACLQTTEEQSLPPQAEPSATYLGDRLDPLAHSFYGRRRESRKLRDGLLHQDQRAVIIHGIGGIGKTALLTHAINRLRPRFKDVMSFNCRRAALAPETILLELHRYFATQGMPQLQSLIGQNVPPETLADEIARMLTEWPLLIVFDNFESQLDERRAFLNEDLRVFLTTLMQATATGSRFLFTTRYLFDLDGERLSNLQELPLGDLSRAEALMLMQKLPNLAQAAYRDKLAVLEKFGGHPYALAALDKHCAHQPLFKALQDGVLLKSELREFLAIELNYCRLSFPARVLLDRIAAFRVNVPFAGAEWVINEKFQSYPYFYRLFDFFFHSIERVLRKLGLIVKDKDQMLSASVHELIDRGLLIPQIKDNKIQSLAVHSLVRDFCLDQQSQWVWRMRLLEAASFYINQTRLIKPNNKLRAEECDDTETIKLYMKEGNFLNASTLLTAAEVWNIMEAFELLMEAENFEEATMTLSMAGVLLDRWGFGHYVSRQYERLSSRVNGRSLALILHNQAILMHERGDYDSALDKYQQALAIDMQLRDRAGIAAVLHEIGLIYTSRGNTEMALDYCQQSLKIFEELEDEHAMARSLYQMGEIHLALGDYKMALERHQQALAMHQKRKDTASIAIVLNGIGNLHNRCGNYDAAKECYEQALAIHERKGDHAYIADTLSNLGTLHYQCGEYSFALEKYQRAFSINEDLGRQASLAVSSAHIGQLFLITGQYMEAFPMLLNAMTTLHSLQLSDEGFVALDLRDLRAKWGEANFDVAWRKAMNDELPSWLTDNLETTLQ